MAKNETPKFNLYDLGSVAKNLNRGSASKTGTIIRSSDPYNASSVIRTKSESYSKKGEK